MQTENIESVEYFSRESKPIKQDIETQQVQMINQIMNLDTQSRLDKKSGLTVLSLTGPAVVRHVENYFGLLGKDGTLHSFETNEKTLLVQHQELYKLDPEKRERTQIHFGDVFIHGSTILKTNLNSAIFMDIDLTKTFEQEWVDGYSRIEQLIASIPQHVNSLFISLTHSQRKQKDRNQMLVGLRKEIPEVVSTKGWDLVAKIIRPYRDLHSPPMITAFYGFRKYGDLENAN